MVYYREHIIKKQCKYLAGDLGASKGQSPNKSYFLWCSIFLILVFTSNKHDSVWKEFIKAFQPLIYSHETHVSWRGQ